VYNLTLLRNYNSVFVMSIPSISTMPEAKIVATNGIKMAVYEAGEGPVVVLAHGFPEIAYSWRNQIPALVAAGFRVITPDLRGYGATERPANVEDYDIQHLTSDLVGLLDALELDKAVFVGHDWGAFICWDLPALHPDRVAGVVSLNVPYGIFRRLEEDPIEYLRRTKGDDTYMVVLQEPGFADQLFQRDTRALFEKLMRARGITREDLAKKPVAYRNLHFEHLSASDGQQFLTVAELDVFARVFAETGFTGGLNYYRNLSRNWQFMKGKPQQIDVPCLMVEVPNDHYMPPGPFDYMRYLIRNVEFAKIENCGHWSQQEQPKAINAILIDWLQRHFK
jgi:pimeloyl-ACP methyl ester carboxylesterase